MTGQGAPAEMPWLVAGTFALTISAIIELCPTRKLTAAVRPFKGISHFSSVNATMCFDIPGCYAVGDALVGNCLSQPVVERVVIVPLDGFEKADFLERLASVLDDVVLPGEFEDLVDQTSGVCEITFAKVIPMTQISRYI